MTDVAWSYSDILPAKPPPCPLCGSDNVTSRPYAEYRYRCDACGTQFTARCIQRPIARIVDFTKSPPIVSNPKQD